jgi:hypothetical protein
MVDNRTGSTSVHNKTDDLLNSLGVIMMSGQDWMIFEMEITTLPTVLPLARSRLSIIDSGGPGVTA